MMFSPAILTILTAVDQTYLHPLFGITPTRPITTQMAFSVAKRDAKAGRIYQAIEAASWPREGGGVTSLCLAVKANGRVAVVDCYGSGFVDGKPVYVDVYRLLKSHSDLFPTKESSGMFERVTVVNRTDVKQTLMVGCAGRLEVAPNSTASSIPYVGDVRVWAGRRWQTLPYWDSSLHFDLGTGLTIAGRRIGGTTFRLGKVKVSGSVSEEELTIEEAKE